MMNEAVKNAHSDTAKRTIERFKKLEKPIVYTPTITLGIYIEKVTKRDALLDKRDALTAELATLRLDLKESEDDLFKFESSFLVLTGEHFGKESDEYEWAGGTRPSVAIEKAKVTRLENQKTEKTRLDAEEAKRKTEEAELKAEFERLKAEDAKRKQTGA